MVRSRLRPALVGALLGALFALIGTSSAVAAQFVHLSAGGRATCGSTVQGQLFCWGDGRVGQLGRVSASTAKHPVRVVGIYDAQSVSAGRDFGCAILNRGNQINVRGIFACWGNGTTGQLGTGTYDRAQYPNQVKAPDGLTQVSAGSATACAIGPGGTVWCWGDDRFGQLGDAAAAVRSATPIQVPGVTDAIDVAVGEQHACAARADGTLMCWGWALYGRTGVPTDAPVVVPTTVPGLYDVAGVAAGAVHTCVRKRDGSVWCFGSNERGQLGNGIPPDVPTNVPTQVAGVSGATAISTGGLSTCVVAGGRVQCWGDGSQGKLGVGSRADAIAPQTVAKLTDVASVSVGQDHVCALTRPGAAFCWGSNRYGQLGNGDVSGVNARSLTPTRVVDYDLGRSTFVPTELVSFPEGSGGGVIELRSLIVKKTRSRYSCPKTGRIRISAKGKAATRKVKVTRRSSTACRISGTFALPNGSAGATVARISVRGTHLRTHKERLKAQSTS